MKIVYAGSPEIASVPLKFLLESGKHQIVAVLTNPPSRKGRHGDLVPTPVEQVARDFIVAQTGAQNAPCDAQLPLILTPEHLDSVVREQISALNPDILVCFAYGKIFGPKFMALFPQGGINLHPSLLPLHRGCAPVPAAILAMEAETGITIQTVAQEMDAGDILLQTRFPILETDTSDSILTRAANEGGQLFLQVLDQIENGTTNPIKQDSSKATYCAMLAKEDGLIDWTKSAAEIDAKIRAFSPWPGAFTFVNGTGLKIHQAGVYKAAQNQALNDNAAQNQASHDAVPGAVMGTDKANGILVQTGDGILAVQNLQLQTKKAMNWKDFLNGTKDFVGSVLNSGN